jgi:beta-lactamase regulating signal transducer with metallopeptidase domain
VQASGDGPALHESTEASHPVSGAPPATGEAGGFALSPSGLHLLLQRLDRVAKAPPDRASRWPEFVAAAILAGLAFGLARLLVGFWGVRVLRRRSRSIAEYEINTLAEALRVEMACSRPVELRETSDLATAATIGWLRPLILLPADWRMWSVAERRAVLAHELAHIRRRDFATGLIGRLSVALHFYHPLVHWLAGRMLLQQELAADAFGARHAGGHGLYVRVLAEMALRQAERQVGWPARTFLPAPGTLMRRIQMLRAKDGLTERTFSRSGRLMLSAVILLGSLMISAVRSPAQKVEDDKPVPTEKGNGSPPAGSGEEKAAEPPAFDVSYLPPDAQGVWAVRPAAIFGRTDMKAQAAKFNKVVALFSKEELKLPPELILPIEDFEQLSGAAVIKTDKTRKENQSALLIQVTMMRSVKEFNWKKQFQTMIPKAVEVEYKGKTYFQAPKAAEVPAILMNFAIHNECCFYFPDERTVVITSEEQVRNHIDGKTPKSKHAWTEDWKRVDRALFAVAFADKSWMEGRKKEEDPVIAATESLMGNSVSQTLALDYTDGFVFQSHWRCETEKAADSVLLGVKQLLKIGQKNLHEPAKDKAPDKADAFMLQLGKDLVKKSKVERDGLTVSWTATMSGSLADLATVFAGMLDEPEPSSPSKSPK